MQSIDGIMITAAVTVAFGVVLLIKLTQQLTNIIRGRAFKMGLDQKYVVSIKYRPSVSEYMFHAVFFASSSSAVILVVYFPAMTLQTIALVALGVLAAIAFAFSVVANFQREVSRHLG